MEKSSDDDLCLGNAAKRIAQRMMFIVENRFQLLVVEAQEERERVLLAVWLALGAAVFGLLTGVALTILIAVVLWEHSPVIALAVLMAIHTLAAGVFYGRLVRLQREWKTLQGTLDQLKKRSRMPGKISHLTPLESRRQMLLVESELNRAQLLNDLRDLKMEMHQLWEQAQGIGSLAASMTKLAASISVIRGAFAHREAGQAGKSFWISTMLYSMRTGTAIWGHCVHIPNDRAI